MDAFTVLVVITLVLICVCCWIYINRQIRSFITYIVRIVKSEMDDKETEAGDME